MAAPQRHRSTPAVLSAAGSAPNRDETEFIAACLDVTNQSVAPDTPVAAPPPVGHRSTAQSGPETVSDSREPVSRLEANVDGVGEALAQARAQVRTSAETLRQHEELRQTIAAAREHRSTDGVEALSLGQLVSEMMLDHSADVAALREAGRRETLLRAELQALRAEHSSLKIEHGQTISALHKASHAASEARAELASAVGDNDSMIDELRQIIAQLDREIGDLQNQLLQVEEARIADAAAILDSLGSYRP